ncbi:anti-sigma factor family protein [Rhodocaloribacter sp.]
MKHEDTEQMLRRLEGRMTPEEARRWERRVAASPELRARADEWRALQSLLRTTVRESSEEALRPFFADRLMRRLRPPAAARAEAFAASLTAFFRPVALAGLLIIAMLVGYNVSSYAYEAEPSPTEAVLGLPPVTLATAFDSAYDPDYETLPAKP